VSSLLSRLNRPPQLQTPFLAGDPESGYYNDLRVELGTNDATEAQRRLRAIVRDRERANHVTVAQLALGAWQMRAEADPDAEAWLQVFAEGAAWLADALEDEGGLPYLFPMPHTYTIKPPWYSAMAQGQAASVFVRAVLSLGDDSYIEAAERAIMPLLVEDSTIVAHTPEGPVLQEYPTQPPSHVLNGWMFALWGVYDVTMLGERAAQTLPQADRAFREGTSALVRRIGLYDAGFGWSRYDLYPHRLVHVASPFYHRLHVALLNATADLTDEAALREKAAAWDAAADSAPRRVTAVARKAAFRVVYPRRLR
jgi:heparosan-N-sulfate-glucuronate 5-epimerase